MVEAPKKIYAEPHVYSKNRNYGEWHSEISDSDSTEYIRADIVEELVSALLECERIDRNGVGVFVTEILNKYHQITV